MQPTEAFRKTKQLKQASQPKQRTHSPRRVKVACGQGFVIVCKRIRESPLGHCGHKQTCQRNEERRERNSSISLSLSLSTYIVKGQAVDPGAEAPDPVTPSMHTWLAFRSAPPCLCHKADLGGSIRRIASQSSPSPPMAQVWVGVGVGKGNAPGCPQALTLPNQKASKELQQ